MRRNLRVPERRTTPEERVALEKRIRGHYSTEEARDELGRLVKEFKKA